MERPLDAERLDIIDVQKVDVTVLPNLPTIQRLVVHVRTVKGQLLALSFVEDALNTLVRAMEAALLARTGARTGASRCAASEDRSIALRHLETHGSVSERDCNAASELLRVDLTDTRTSLPDHQKAVIEALRAALPILRDMGALVSASPNHMADDIAVEVRQALALAEAAGLARPNPT